MNQNESEVIAQEIDTEETVNDEEQIEEVEETTKTEEAKAEDDSIETLEELKKRLATAEAQKDHWREKAGKVKNVASEGLTAGDIKAIGNANIPDDDMDLVQKFATDNNLSIRDSLKHPHMKAVLAYESETRNTAIAANVENVRRGSIKITDDTLLNNAQQNKLPTDDDQIEQLVAAKFKNK